MEGADFLPYLFFLYLFLSDNEIYLYLYHFSIVMVKIKNIKLVNYGNSKCLIIPADFIQHGVIDIALEYDVDLVPSESTSNKD